MVPGAKETSMNQEIKANSPYSLNHCGYRQKKNSVIGMTGNQTLLPHFPHFHFPRDWDSVGLNRS